MFIRARVGSAARRIGFVALAFAALGAPAPAHAGASPGNLAAQASGRSAVPLPLLAEAVGEGALLRADDPRALTAADFDSDGLPDLAAGFGGSGASGGGAIVVAAGNPDAIYPNTPEAKARREDGSAIAAPFYPAHVTLWIPLAPDFLLSGDFDADGDQDLLAFARGGDQAAFLAGDGRGDFAPAAVLGLPGRVTAAITADVNRRDGMADVLLGLETKDGPALLVAEGPAGAIRPMSERFLLSSPTRAIAAGYFDDDPWVDIAVGSGAELWIVRGRDRRLSQDDAERAAVPAARVDRLGAPADITALVAGDWSRGFHDLAILGSDGRARFLAHAALAQLTPEGDEVAFERETAELAGVGAAWLPARIGTGSADVLVLLDRAAGRLRRFDPLASGDSGDDSGDDSNPTPSLLAAADEAGLGEPVAALALRLNSDALSDLVVMTRGGAETVLLVPSAPTATFIVNSTNDANDGTCNGAHCSLREAINAANSAVGPDTILFSGMGAGFHTISPSTNLPTITATTLLDGTSHPDGRIEIDGTSVSTGLTLSNAPSSLVRGVVINRASNTGLDLQGASGGSVVEGSYFGLDYAGAAISTINNTGVLVQSNSITVGGALPAARNIISGTNNYALFLNGVSGAIVRGNYIGTDAAGTNDRFNGSYAAYSSGALSPVIGGVGAGEGNLISGANSGAGLLLNGAAELVQGNRIGTDWTGTSPVPNSTGVYVVGTTGALVGGTAAGAGNLISGNQGSGVQVTSAPSTTIQGNRIGTRPDGLAALPNAFGVYLQTAATVGGVAAGAGNILARNANDGVAVAGGVGSAVRGNSIFGNGGLGIDLSDNGRSPNDLNDSDAGPNLMQNFPVLIAATISGGNLFVTYSVNSDPGNAAYPLTVDFYESDLLGQGRVYLGTNTYTAADFTVGAKIVNLGNAGVLGVVQPEPLVAVATDSGANSSEFSDARLVGIGGATSFIVNTINDGDDGLCDIVHCSLREALQYANLNSGFADTIPFNIPGSPPFSIAPGSPLPAITDPVTVNAATQPGFAGTPIVELNGTSASGAPGLRLLSAANTTIRGLVINRFNSGGIQIANSPSAILVGNYIGTDVAGAGAQGNGTYGVSIEAGSDNTLVGGATVADRNLISGNANGAIVVQSAANVVIRGNRIGTNAAGTLGLSGAANGIEASGTSGLVVGGAGTGQGNLISGNIRGLYLISTTGATIRGNLIGTDAAGTGLLGNSYVGVDSNASAGMTLGGALPGEGNVIAGGGGAGVVWSFATGGTIQGNFIGVAADGVSPLSNNQGVAFNGGSGVLVGGSLPGERNIIARNGASGVGVYNGGLQHAIRRNSIFQNGGLGIDLDLNGFTANDPLDADLGPNQLQNFPQFQSVAITGGNLIVTYLVDSHPVNATYPLAVEFFKPDSVASFEGKTFVAADSYSAADFTLGAKTVNLGSAVALGVAVGSRLVAMATDAAGNSSEFSPTWGVTGPPQIYVVNTTNDLDDGACDVTHCSLREAIDAATTNLPAIDSIHFNIPGVPPHVIQPQSPLPDVGDATILNATTQPGFAGSPIVQLSGASTCCEGLRLAATGSTVRGFVVRNWPGIGIYDFAGNATIAGNFLGTDVTGMLAQFNNAGLLTTGAGTVVGGSTAADRNLISGNGTGLVLNSGSFARGNWIGLNATGAAPLPNGSGVGVQDATLGGTGAGEANVVSGNSGVGVTVYGSASLVQGNFIGTNPTGSGMLGNVGGGISTFASGGTLGGPLPGAGNLVSGNGGNGILVSGGSGLTIQGNWIGLDASGTLDFGNAQSGVRFESAASLHQLMDNIISGNANGVRIESASNAIVLTGNRIGTNAAGNAPLGNTGIGVEILDAPLVQVGAGGQGNLISGNGGRGVRISGGGSAGALVRGNFIGTDASGSFDVGNASDGIEVVDTSGVQIGGAGAGESNLISGNNLRGVVLSGSGTTGTLVTGNLIGTDLSGTVAVPNSGAGIEINAAPGNFIGGTGAGQRNLISGNGSIGIYVNGSNATGNVISGNFIGTDGLGIAALGNGSSGVDISSAPANLVGGTAPGAGNLISGNGGIGVSISFSGATANQVQGNWIGTNLTGTGAIANAADGVQIFAAPGNTIGGSAIGAGNVISGNTLSGVSLNFSGAAGNFVYGNLIGTQGDATTPLPNGLSGVTIAFNASSNRIGGPSPGQGNVIAGNTDDGITVESGVNDRLSGNSYFANGGLAIDLGPDGVQPADVGDGDSGANLLQNYPYLAAVSSDGATTTSIAGSVSSTANATFTVELYASAGCDASGHGEGSTYLGSTTILADASGAAAFLISLPVGVANGATVTGVAITAGGSSSEFGPCILEDDLAIFVDSFEMGDSSAWATPLQP